MRDYLNNKDIKYCVDCVYYGISHISHFPKIPSERAHCIRPRIPLSIVTKQVVTWGHIYCEQDRKEVGNLVNCGYEAQFFRSKTEWTRCQECNSLGYEKYTNKSCRTCNGDGIVTILK